MAYTKKTLRKMPAATRKIGELVNEAELVARRLKALIPQVELLEKEARALNSMRTGENLGPVFGWPPCRMCNSTMVIKERKGLTCPNCGWPANITEDDPTPLFEDAANG